MSLMSLSLSILPGNDGLTQPLQEALFFFFLYSCVVCGAFSRAGDAQRLNCVLLCVTLTRLGWWWWGGSGGWGGSGVVQDGLSSSSSSSCVTSTQHLRSNLKGPGLPSSLPTRPRTLDRTNNYAYPPPHPSPPHSYSTHSYQDTWGYLHNSSSLS